MASAAQHDQQAEQTAEFVKLCQRCGDERMLFYFPVRKSHPQGWVICYACQHDLKLQAQPPRQCAFVS